MGGVLDFLFEGRPPASVTTYGESSTNVPTWLSDYTQGLIARANSVSAEPYQAYGGPRVAAFNQDQTNAQQAVRNNQGIWSGDINNASTLIGGAGAASGLAAANPYLQAGTGSYTDQVQKYMDPYAKNVIDRSSELANRNFTEKLMPSIKSNFIKAGAYGSAGQQRAVGQALRDTTGEVQSQALAALSDAYKTGASIYGDEASRNLTAGATAGSLAGADAGRSLQAGQNLGTLAALRSQLAGQDAAGLAQVGQDEQNQIQRNYDTAYGDFQAQRDYPKTQTEWLNSIIRGTDVGQTSNTSSTGPASTYGPSGLSQLGSVLSAYQGIKGLWGGDDESQVDYVGLSPDIKHRAQGGLARYASGGRMRPGDSRANQVQSKMAALQLASSFLIKRAQQDRAIRQRQALVGDRGAFRVDNRLPFEQE